MKILVITDLYPVKDKEKNTPRTIYDFVQAWKQLGHDVRVIKPNFLLNSLIRKKPLYASKIYGEVENINYFLPFLGNIKNKIKTEFMPDIVIAHMPSGLIFANKLKMPFIAGVHISDLEVLTNPLYSLYFKSELEKAYKNAKKIACRSEVLKNKFLNLYPQYENKVFTAYSGIDEKFITQKFWKKKDRYKILTCANLIKRKNIDKVIKACEQIDNADLTVIGTGSEFKNLQKLSSKPVFKGYLEHSKVLEEMRNSDIFVLTSENETFGMVYLEAIASGCVTIGLKNDGIDGIIKDGINGYLTDKNSVYETLKKVISCDNSVILQNSYETAQLYTKENVAMNYIKNIE